MLFHPTKLDAGAAASGAADDPRAADPVPGAPPIIRWLCGCQGVANACCRSSHASTGMDYGAGVAKPEPCPEQLPCAIDHGDDTNEARINPYPTL